MPWSSIYSLFIRCASTWANNYERGLQVPTCSNPDQSNKRSSTTAAARWASRPSPAVARPTPSPTWPRRSSPAGGWTTTRRCWSSRWSTPPWITLPGAWPALSGSADCCLTWATGCARFTAWPMTSSASDRRWWAWRTISRSWMSGRPIRCCKTRRWPGYVPIPTSPTISCPPTWTRSGRIGCAAPSGPTW